MISASVSYGTVVIEEKPLLFTALSTEALRDLAKRTDYGTANWDQWDRPMLLAFFHNRYRDGVVPTGLR